MHVLHSLRRPRRAQAVVVALAVVAAPLAVATAAAPHAAAASACPWVDSAAPVSTRVSELLAQMSLAQKVAMMTGTGGSYVGNIAAIPALCIPAMNLEDGPAGVGDGMSNVTQLPAPVDVAATWDTAAEQEYGSVIGAEQAAKGTTVDLGPTINIVRDPRWGRAFESLGEDPYLAGQLSAADIRGVQSAGTMAQVKHFAVYNQETNRNTSSDNAVVSTQAEQEIYLPAFQAAVQQGAASSVMCSYSWINGTAACQNPYTLGTVLRQQFGYTGFVTSDWGATHSTAASANAGLDMDMPGNDGFYGTALVNAVNSGSVSTATVNTAVSQILTQMFAFGEFDKAPGGSPSATATSSAHQADATQLAEEGTVLLKNSGSVLPLTSSDTSVAVIGADASTSVQSDGGGSAGVNSSGTVTPLQGIEAAAPAGTTVTYNNGSSDSSAASAASAASVAVVFANLGESEGSDLSSIDLGTTQDNLITAVAAANPDTVVVLNTGSAVTMPWLSSVKGVLEAWYPGQEDGTAIASVLFGGTDPSGHLTVTFPASLSQVPASTTAQWPGTGGTVQYSEGIDVGYRWYDSKSLTPLFPFGYGLSYTTFSFSNLNVGPLTAGGAATVTATVTNTGTRSGADVAQLYVTDPSASGQPPLQLEGFQRVNLAAGASATVTFTLTQQNLQYWNSSSNAWATSTGNYGISVGDSSASLPLAGTLTVASTQLGAPVTLANPGPQASLASQAATSVTLSGQDTTSGQTLTYTATGLPAGLSISTAGVISGTPTTNGTTTVTVTAKDGNGAYATQSFVWTVAPGNASGGPTPEAPFGGTAAAVPGTVQAANYDTGGQGVAYNVSSVNGTGNSYRSDGVDLEACTDTGCGDDIGWTATGQWFKYTVNVATAGTYTVSLRLAAPSAVTDGLHIASSSGTNLSGNINVPATGGWQDWTTVTASVTLPAGQQTLTIDQDNGGWNIHQLTFASSSSSEAPFGGTAAAVPGTVQAANYDTGGQGVAYNVSSVNGTANSYRSDGVDLEACTDTGCGDDIGWTATGQWFKYTINASTAKTYTVTLRLAAPSAVTDGLHIASSSGANLSGNINVPATGGWQDWTTVTVTVTLPAGQQTLTIDQDNGGWNIHQLTFT
jgi:beta-glucosidase